MFKQQKEKNFSFYLYNPYFYTNEISIDKNICHLIFLFDYNSNSLKKYLQKFFKNP